MRTIKRTIIVFLLAALCAALFAPAALAVDPYAPIITSQTTGPIILKPGESITLQVVAESPEGLPLTYRWYQLDGDDLTPELGSVRQVVPFVSKMKVKPFKDVEDRLYYCLVTSRRTDPITGETTVHRTQSEVVRVQCDYNFWYIMGAYFRWMIGVLQFVFTFPIVAIVAFFV